VYSVRRADGAGDADRSNDDLLHSLTSPTADNDADPNFFLQRTYVARR
jgi:hypothetical protein